MEKKNNKGNLIIISGPSGAGKSTVVSRAISNNEHFCFSVSVTTRNPRPGEVDGKDYFFITREQFTDMADKGLLLEYAQYVDNYYGTPADYVNSKLEAGINVVLDIEIQGARKVISKIPDAITIFVIPPSISELRRRLTNRGTDSEEVIEARLKRAMEEYSEADFYKYMIINDDVDKAASEFLSIITAEKCKFSERQDYLNRI